MAKEIEIKIELAPKEFKKFVSEYPGDFYFERTFGYFKEDFSNVKEGIFPRIKCVKKGNKNKEIILTVKRKLKDETKFFEREEMEIKLPNGKNLETLRKILKSLGFKKEIIFEKKRKSILKDDIVICFDELPFGVFVEFEGKPRIINNYLKKFNLSNRPRITKAYLALWKERKKTYNINEENCVFK